VATTARDMNTLCDRLDGLADRLMEEYRVELPRERRDAKGDATLLANLDRRETDLKTAFTIHGDAKKVYVAGQAAYKVDPAELDARYAEALGLTAKLEAVLDYRKTKNSDKSESDTKVDKTKVDDKDTKEPKADADKPKDDKPKTGTDEKSKTEPKADSDKEKVKGKADDKPEPDAVLAAIKGLTESCTANHTQAMNAIAALEPRLIKPELAKIINGRTPEQLAAALNGHGVTPQQAAFLEALVAKFSTVDEFVALLGIQDAGFLDRFRFAFGGNGTAPSTPIRGGSHR
jgi:hypothetical protein